MKGSRVFFIMLLLAGAIAGQGTLTATSWTKIVAPDDAFFVYMPNGFRTGIEGGFFAGTKHNTSAQVDSVVRLGHFVGDTAILLEYYSGDAKKLQNFYDDFFGCGRTGESSVGGFSLRSFEGESKGIKCRGISARRKDSLYVVRVFSSDPAEVVSKAVINSVRLLEGGTTKNMLGVIDTNIVVPRAIKGSVDTLMSDTPFNEGEVDRQAFVLTSSRASVPYGFPRPKTGKEITVEVKVVLAADGSVSVVSVDNGMKTLHPTVTEAAKKTIFIPAQKDGKAVSVYRTFRYTFF